MKRVIALFLSLTLGLTMAIAATAASACDSWNFALDYMRAPDQPQAIYPDSCGNPVWYFMKSGSLTPDPATYTLLDNFANNLSGMCTPGTGFKVWSTPNGEYTDPGLPLVDVNVSGVDQSCSTVVLKNVTAYVHPYASSRAVVGWKSPISGKVQVSVTMADADHCGCDGVDWLVQKGGTTLASGWIDHAGAASWASCDRVRVNQGEFLFFSVGPGAEMCCDTTALDITITAVNDTCL